jgi:hypothetical protein
MRKYRIIETKTPKMESNISGVWDFIPEIGYISIFHVEEYVCDKFLWMKFEDWIEVKFVTEYGYKDKFTSIEQAEKFIEFREKQDEVSIVKTY